MTRVLKVVNLSNYDGEDFEIVQVSPQLDEPIHKTIAPGETTFVEGVHKDGALLFKPVESKKPEPFRDDEGRQKVPYMETGFKSL